MLMNELKYSIIIPYRDRLEHLEILLPVLNNKFKDEKYEIIVSEQDDNNGFSISNTVNMASKFAKGDVLIIHNVDYVPMQEVEYYKDGGVFLPVKKVLFLNEDNSNLRETSDIPGGYRYFNYGVGDDFFGGVICILKTHFETINGYNPYYVGWGKEDEDLRLRISEHNIPINRGEGIFFALYHSDSGQVKDDINSQLILKNREYFHTQAKLDIHIGVSNLSSDVRWCENTFTVTYDNVRWLKSTNYKVDGNLI